MQTSAKHSAAEQDGGDKEFDAARAVHTASIRVRRGRANYQSLGDRNGCELLRVGGVEGSLR